jgi:hypothetical protein
VRARIANLDPDYLAAKVNRCLFGDSDPRRVAGLR